MDWWIDPDEYQEEPIKNYRSDIDWNQKVCYHDWKPILLIITVVYNCTKCGIKKEAYDEWKKQSG
jgi:hypothetical protein